MQACMPVALRKRAWPFKHIRRLAPITFLCRCLRDIRSYIQSEDAKRLCTWDMLISLWFYFFYEYFNKLFAFDVSEVVLRQCAPSFLCVFGTYGYAYLCAWIFVSLFFSQLVGYTSSCKCEIVDCVPTVLLCGRIWNLDNIKKSVLLT